MLPFIALLRSMPEVLENQKFAVMVTSLVMLLFTVTVTVCPSGPVLEKVSVALAEKVSVKLREACIAW